MKLEAIRGKRILIIGDILIDTYYVGDVKRISPEAPVPVVRVNNTYSVLGGAANVARNLMGIECNPTVLGLIGNDENGKLVNKMFEDLKAENVLFPTLESTVTKIRILGNNQQIARLDFEKEFHSISRDEELLLTQAMEKLIPEIDVVVVSDYGKGVCNELICKNAIELSSRYNKPIIIDPKGFDWHKYENATIVTPNLKELSDIYGEEVENRDNPIHIAGRFILNKYNIHSLLITRSEKGMSFIDRQTSVHISTEAKEVFDVSGAGDTVVAVLAAALAAKFSLHDAINLSNKAAGIVVGKIGTSPILYDELETGILKRQNNKKVISADDVQEIVKKLKGMHSKIVFTNGCFDILHQGHVSCLQEAKKLGDILIVGVNSDDSVKRLKGPSRPINDEASRSIILSALECVDYVTVFADDTPLELIKTICPDVLVKGGDYAIEDIVGREFAKEIVIIPFLEGFSTTSIIDKLY
ncbi:D-glycero-beta-D-manno-heptose-7-phosphate kinase [uncultured Proteiniphilum sp.]|uniref:D-glycero-beta-D-manno-heptose-7-phosphate kinase n=1 Tax=uncultured Proteiniphilum sp. TaxID=497637 RepID=UPI002630D5AA|nr:D-glycero-beta-D-manno-heptose-7-phosphate kinase [uncultured Proteiniphilum sp.]